MLKAINIISFDVPSPPNYGGAIDVYYKLLWLNKAGVKIHLHCFTYGRPQAKVLEALCEKVYYYQRKTGFFSGLSLLPYTVKSRQSKELEKNLLSNNFPILFEVLHTCYLLNDERFRQRKKIYRHSNIEHHYYSELSKSEKSLFKKLYLKIEAWKLKRFESILHHADIILPVNEQDAGYFRSNYTAAKTVYLPSFHENESIAIEAGRGDYILFHGNLSVSENYDAVFWLVEHVFSKTNIKVIIAGLKPPAFLQQLLHQHTNISLIANPSQHEMQALIKDAQAHVLYTSQPTGLKLKLLNVLFRGRFIICNASMLSGTQLKENATLLLANSPDSYLHHINTSFKQEFSNELVKEREQLLTGFNNSANTKKLIEVVFTN